MSGPTRLGTLRHSWTRSRTRGSDLADHESLRLQPRNSRSALYLFEEVLDVDQPSRRRWLTSRASVWTTPHTIKRERTAIPSRAASGRSSGAL